MASSHLATKCAAASQCFSTALRHRPALPHLIRYTMTRSYTHQKTQNYMDHPAVKNRHLNDPHVRAAYNILEIHPDSTITEVRHAYFQLAKKYHPDSISQTTADTTADTGIKFAAVYNAYEKLREVYAERDAENGSQAVNDWMQFAQEVANAEGHDVSEKARAKWSSNEALFNRKLPQSRHYLSNEGVGFGPSPFERNKQYRNHVVGRAVDSVSDYKRHQLEQDMEKSRQEQHTSSNQQQQNNKGFSVTDIISLIKNIEGQAEDRIIQKKSKVQRLEETIKSAMQDWEGGEEWKNKQLNTIAYDTGDPLTNRLNAILSRNGVVPEWLRIEAQIYAHYDAAYDQLAYHWNTIQYLDTELAEREREEEQVQRRLEQEEVDRAWSAASRGERQKQNAALAKQLMKDLLADRYHVSSTANEPQRYAYHNHQHSTAKELEECHHCRAWTKAIELAKSDLKRTNRLVNEFNLAVPAINRQKMMYLAQNLIAEVTYSPPSTEPQLYRSSFRVQPRDIDEAQRNDAQYYNRQEHGMFDKAAYNKSIVQASIAATVGVTVLLCFMTAGMIRMAQSYSTSHTSAASAITQLEQEVLSKQ